MHQLKKQPLGSHPLSLWILLTTTWKRQWMGHNNMQHDNAYTTKNLCICLDASKLNKATIKQPYYYRTLDDVILLLNDAKYLPYSISWKVISITQWMRNSPIWLLSKPQLVNSDSSAYSWFLTLLEMSLHINSMKHSLDSMVHQVTHLHLTSFSGFFQGIGFILTVKAETGH